MHLPDPKPYDTAIRLESESMPSVVRGRGTAAHYVYGSIAMSALEIACQRGAHRHAVGLEAKCGIEWLWERKTR
jgi:hypothetical protein